MKSFVRTRRDELEEQHRQKRVASVLGIRELSAATLLQWALELHKAGDSSLWWKLATEAEAIGAPGPEVALRYYVRYGELPEIKEKPGPIVRPGWMGPLPASDPPQSS